MMCMYASMQNKRYMRCVFDIISTGGSSVGRAADCRACGYLLVPGSIPGRRICFEGCLSHFVQYYVEV